MHKISIITVTYNAAAFLEATINSVIRQTYTDFEYIIIDGNSSDGTLDIIKKYSTYINSWVSEKDNGLYDAMNKGIEKASGEWVFFINAGDYFVTDSVLENIFKNKDYNNIDILYGNAIENKDKAYIKHKGRVVSHKLPPEYRHGASFVRTEVHKNNLFDLSLKNKLGYSLDYQCIYSLFKSGHIFQKVDVDIIIYDANGISNHPIKSKWYRSLIQNDCQKSFLFYLKFVLSVIKAIIKRFSFLKYLFLSIYWLFTDYIVNHIIFHVPFWFLRKFYLILCGAKIKRRTQIDLNCTILDPYKLKIGKCTHINRNCLLDARGELYIGDNVSISQRVAIVTGSHDLHSEDFAYLKEPIIINDYAWIGVNATILGGVNIGKGAVVCAGAVVTKDVEDYAIVAGIPAKQIGIRNHKLSYTPLGDNYYWPMFI